MGEPLEPSNVTLTHHVDGGDRERQVAQTFVELADTLVAGFDVIEFLTLLSQRFVHLLSVAEAGILLSNPQGRLQVAASSSEEARLVELFELQAEEGPCLDCYRTGRAVVADDLAAASDRWPRFVPVAVDAGFRSVHALPMRLREDTLGSVNLFGDRVGPLAEDDRLLGQALADVATIGLLQERASRESQLLAEQLGHALDSRVVIEQAKGVLAERNQVSMGDAFGQLRRSAREHNLRLSDVAERVAAGELSALQLTAPPAP
ncbi:GAF and ANTAR domain-containing protein [soil metagenome]